MAKPIAFGDYYFQTKTSAIKESQDRINKYDFGEKLRLEDESFFLSLFTLHSEYSEKKGAGISFVTVERDFHNNRCLYIHRTDESKIDCSWRHCMQPASQKTVISMAFRRAVKEIIQAYKSDNLIKVKLCPVFGTPLTYENSHASYLSPSFDEMLMEFLKQQKIDIESVALINPDPDDTDQRGQISDQTLLKNWLSFHKKEANLHLLSAEANLRGLKPNKRLLPK